MDSSKNTLPNEAYDDEISLRDLYLILKRNIFWILAIPLLAGIVAFTVISFMPPTYSAQSTTVVTPPPIEVESEQGITFKPTVDVPFESYERLALSLPVITATHQELLDQQLAPEELTVKALTGMLELERLTGPTDSGAGTPLSVSHIARSNDPELSAAIANIWAEKSLETVRNSLLSTLSPVDDGTIAELGILEERLERAEQALESFQANNDLQLRRSRIEQLSSRITNSEMLLDDLSRRLTVSEARRDVLSSQLQEEMSKVTTSDPTSDGYLAGLTLEEAVQFLERQHDRAKAQRDEARAALIEFDDTHNLGVLRSQIERFQSVVATGELDLERLRDQLSVLEERRALLDEQLMQAAASSATTNLVSNEFLSGLTLGESLEFVDAQLAAAEEAWSSARSNLDTFDSANNIDLLNSQVDQLNSRVAAKEARLEEIPGELVVLGERIENLNVQLDQEPLSLRLQDQLFASPALTEAARAAAQNGELLSGTELQRETLNPTHSSLLNQLLSAQTQQLALQAEQEVLNEELEQARTQLQAYRQDLVSLRSERIRLALVEDQARSAHSSLRAKAQELRLAQNDPRGTSRTIRASYDTQHLSPELSLQDEIRAVEREMGTTVSEMRVLEARLDVARERLPELRAQLLELEDQRALLSQEADRATSAFAQIENKRSSLQMTSLDARTDRSLRDTTPEVLALQEKLRSEEVTVQATQSELTVLQQQVATDERRLEQLRAELAQLETQQAQLVRARDHTRAAYDNVARLEPTISYMTQLAPTSARILNDASVPMEPSGPGRLLITVLAGLVTGMLTVLFVFLKEAVRDPKSVRSEGGAGRTADATA